MASDPYALCSSKDCMSRWGAFIAKPKTECGKPNNIRVKGSTDVPMTQDILGCQTSQQTEREENEDIGRKLPNQSMRSAVVKKRSTGAKTHEGMVKAWVIPSEVAPSLKNQKKKSEKSALHCLFEEETIQYCNCYVNRKYPWEEEQSENPDKDPFVGMALVFGSPGEEDWWKCIQQQGEEPRCCVINPEELVPVRRSIRNQNKKIKEVSEPPLMKSNRAELEEIVRERQDEEGSSEFLCKWKGFNETHNSWINEKGLKQAQGLVKDWRRKQISKESKSPRSENLCGTKVTRNMVYTHDPKPTDEELDVTMGLGMSSGLDNHAPTTFQPQLETTASKMLRESQAATTAKCPELKILLYLIKNGWKKSPDTGQLEHSQVYDKYSRYALTLREMNGSIYRLRTEEADSADNEQQDRIKPPSCGRELQ